MVKILQNDNINTNSNHKYLDYSEYWSKTIEKLDEIQSKLNISLQNLEKKYSGFEEIYSHLEENLNVLSSIYSSYNSIKGKEYILKLNTMINNYRKRYTREGIDFNLMNFILTKIQELRESSIENFPLLEHMDTPDEGIREETSLLADIDYSKYYSRPYKWITFERNNSWFITRFEEVTLLHRNDTEILTYIEPDIILIKNNNEMFKVKDIFSPFSKESTDPQYYIIINGKKKGYAISRMGKRIYSRSNFILKLIRPYKDSKESNFSPGHVKLFGKNHILIK